MTQPAEPETIDLAICSCEACDQLFLVSPRRGTCPGCGGGPGLTFFEFQDGPDGLHLLLAPELAPATPQAPVEALPISEPPPEPYPAPTPAETLLPDEPTLVWSKLASFVTDYFSGHLSSVDLEVEFLAAGIDPEDASTAIGRLFAVRDLIQSLGREEPA